MAASYSHVCPPGRQYDYYVKILFIIIRQSLPVNAAVKYIIAVHCIGFCPFDHLTSNIVIAFFLFSDVCIFVQVHIQLFIRNNCLLCTP